MIQLKYSVESILGKRINRKSKVDAILDKPEYLIKWVGFDVNQSTWEPIKNLRYIKRMINQYQQSIIFSQKLSQQHMANKIKIDQQFGTKQSNIFQQNRIIQSQQENLCQKSNFKKVIDNKCTQNQSNFKLKIMEIGKFNEDYVYLTIDNGRQFYHSRDYLMDYYQKELIEFYESKIQFINRNGPDIDG